jgi:hypothetical protein
MELGILSHAPSSPFPTPMSNTASELGTCPFCGSAIPAGAILVEYKAEGETRVFAECFECEEPVQPQ